MFKYMKWFKFSKNSKQLQNLGREQLGRQRGREQLEGGREQLEGGREQPEGPRDLELPGELRCHEYLTLNLDTDKYLYLFFNLKELLIIGQLNKSINKLVQTYTIVKQFLEFRTYEGHHCLVNFVCANNYIELLNQLYILSNNFSYTFDTIIWIIKNGHMRILEWFLEKNLNLKFIDCNVLVMYCLICQRSDILDRLLKCAIVNQQNITINKKTIAYQYMIQNKNCTRAVHIKYELKMACASGMVEVLDILNKDKDLEEYFEDKNLSFGENKLNLVRIVMMNNHYQILEWICINYNNCVKNNIDKYIIFLIQHNNHSMIKWFIEYKTSPAMNNYKIKDIKNLIKIAQDKHCTKIVDILTQIN